MNCPDCDAPTRVLESRRAEDGAAMRRRRECTGCGRRHTTFERFQGPRLYVLKRSGERQDFNRAKLRAALLRAAHKRPVSAMDVEALVDRIQVALEAAGGELEADRVARLCLDGLRDLDHGAFLQFAGTLPEPVAELAPPNPEFARSPEAGSVRGARESSQLPPESPPRRAS